MNSRGKGGFDDLNQRVEVIAGNPLAELQQVGRNNRGRVHNGLDRPAHLSIFKQWGRFLQGDDQPERLGAAERDDHAFADRRLAAHFGRDQIVEGLIEGLEYRSFSKQICHRNSSLPGENKKGRKQCLALVAFAAGGRMMDSPPDFEMAPAQARDQTASGELRFDQTRVAVCWTAFFGDGQPIVAQPFLRPASNTRKSPRSKANSSTSIPVGIVPHVEPPAESAMISRLPWRLRKL